MRDADAAKSRMWIWGNPAKTHYSSGAPVGYKIMCKDLVPLLVKDDSLVARRAPFAKHHIWTVPYSDNSLYPAGKFPTQTKQAPEDSLEGWVARNDSISNVDCASLSLSCTVSSSRARRADVEPPLPPSLTSPSTCCTPSQWSRSSRWASVTLHDPKVRSLSPLPFVRLSH